MGPLRKFLVNNGQFVFGHFTAVPFVNLGQYLLANFLSLNFFNFSTVGVRCSIPHPTQRPSTPNPIPLIAYGATSVFDVLFVCFWLNIKVGYTGNLFSGPLYCGSICQIGTNIRELESSLTNAAHLICFSQLSWKRAALHNFMSVS